MQMCFEGLDEMELREYMSTRADLLVGYRTYLDAYARESKYDSSAAAAQLLDKYIDRLVSLCNTASPSSSMAVVPIRVLNDGAGWRSALLSQALAEVSGLPQCSFTHIDVVEYVDPMTAASSATTVAAVPSASSSSSTTSSTTVVSRVIPAEDAKVQIVSGTDTTILGIGVFDVRIIINALYHWKSLEALVRSLRIGGMVLLALVEGFNPAYGLRFAYLLRSVACKLSPSVKMRS